ncbi:NADH dehydrogenase [Rhodococcus sp. 27YEA15]|uniref:NAD(P)/FAD-dependent oxidoreductase n=1 Tax=Rhodococcus sp. 27YEA15 TaxID=3156259 RepID=UPI003C7C8E5E
MRTRSQGGPVSNGRSEPRRPTVVVIGGGYAGTLAANRLTSVDDIDVVLINPRPHFVERIRLHQVIAGSGTADVGYDTLLHGRVRLMVATASRIDVAAGTVELAGGDHISYDYLVYAVGSRGRPLDVPGAREHGYIFAEWEDAQILREHLAAVAVSGVVTIVGGGSTGVEVSAELAESGRRVRLICAGEPAPTLSERGRRSTRRVLRRLGVEIHEQTCVTEVRRESVLVVDRDGVVTELPGVATVITAGFEVPDLARRSGLTTDDLGRLSTDETLTSVDDPRIVAAGDASAPSGHPLRMSCQAAEPLGAQSANTILSRIAGTVPTPLNQAFVGQNVSLGRRRATIQLSRLDDAPRRLVVSGRFGASIKEAICRGTLWAIRREARRPGSYTWLRGGDRAGVVGADTERR